MIIYSLDLLLFLSFTKLTNDSWVWGIFTSGSHALGICKCFVSTRNLGTKHHRLCHRVDQLVRCSAPRPPLLLRVCSAPPAVPFSVSLRAQQYTAESDSWTEPFFKWKDYDFLWYVASNSLLIPFSLTFVVFRRSCGPSLEHWTYQKTVGYPVAEKVQLMVTAAFSGRVTWPPNWVTESPRVCPGEK